MGGTLCPKSFVLSSFVLIHLTDEKDFLSGIRVMTALDKIGSQYLRTEFRCDDRRFLEDFVDCLLLTVATRSVIGQGMSCLSPALVIRGDDVSPFKPFTNLLDGFLEKGWACGSKIEPCRAEYQSFVQEQRQLEGSSTRSRPDVGDALSFCSAQAGFRARQHLFKVCSVSNRASCFALS